MFWYFVRLIILNYNVFDNFLNYVQDNNLQVENLLV